MQSNANSVNIGSATSDKKPYHHGDLRLALVENGMRLIETSDANHLSLREVARETGVSAAAVYRHFPDKAALMLALANEGMVRLGAAQRTATAGAGGGWDGFVASGVAYVRFAADNPALFRLVFSYVPPISLLDASLEQVGSAMRDLREDIQKLMPAHLTEAERKIAALHAWALVHGLAELILDGHVARDWAVIEKVVGGATPQLEARSSE
jgi:AcrR family transcriptional regulator